MPYDIYNLLVKKLTNVQVWNLNAEELCDKFDKIIESEVQELQNRLNTSIEYTKGLERDFEKLQKENQELKEYIQKLADKIEYDENKELLELINLKLEKK
jgi:predicted nuclease with TOPRIM domain